MHMHPHNAITSHFIHAIRPPYLCDTIKNFWACHDLSMLFTSKGILNVHFISKIYRMQVYIKTTTTKF